MNEVRTWANYNIDPAMQQLEGRPSGMNRAARAQELIDERAGSITTPYLFSVLRDRDLYPFDSTLSYDNRGNVAVWCYGGRTNYCHFEEISADYPDFLSVLWITPNFPVTSPFLPFFIGLEEVPPSFADADTNQTEVFQELFT